MRCAVLITACLLALRSFAEIELVQNFSTDPFQAAWKRIGNAQLYSWNEAEKALEVGWDSDLPNSAAFIPIGALVTTNTSFSAVVTLEIERLDVEFTPPYAFELSFGFFNPDQVGSLAYKRWTGSDSPNLIEFDYFPDTGFGSTMALGAVSREGRFLSSFNFPREISMGDHLVLRLSFDATNQVVHASCQKNGVECDPLKDLKLTPQFTGFSLSSFGFSSYFDGSNDGRLTARALVRSVAINASAEPLGLMAANEKGGVELRINADAGHHFALERTFDFREWTVLSTNETGTNLPPLHVESTNRAEFFRTREIE